MKDFAEFKKDKKIHLEIFKEIAGLYTGNIVTNYIGGSIVSIIGKPHNVFIDNDYDIYYTLHNEYLPIRNLLEIKKILITNLYIDTINDNIIESGFNAEAARKLVENKDFEMINKELIEVLNLIKIASLNGKNFINLNHISYDVRNELIKRGFKIEDQTAIRW